MKTLILSFALLLPAAAGAQSLQSKLDALAPGQWLSYDVPMQPDLRTPCCFEWNGRDRAQPGTCDLSKRDWNSGMSDDAPRSDASSKLRVLVRRSADGIDRLHAIGANCPVATGGQIVVEGGAIGADESVAVLATELDDGKTDDSHALMAIAHHAGREADRVLAEAATGKTRHLRGEAPFWLANTRGEFGYRTVRDLIESKTGEDQLNQLVFALSISPLPAAKADLRRMAREHARPHVRGEALFWLAQEKDAQAEAILRDAVANDASAHVRKKAVFAMSQLPAERAVIVLRELVEHSDQREVRKEALFWLAQVDDDAVLPVFDELLGGRN